MEKQLLFRYELQDFVDVQSLVKDTKLISTRKLLFIFGTFILVLLALYLGIYLYFNLLSLVNPRYFPGLPFNRFMKNIFDLKDSFLCLLFLIAPTLLTFLSVPIMKFRLWLTMRKNPELIKEDRKLTFSEQGIDYSTNSINLYVKWNYFSHAVEGRKHFILVKAKDNIVIIPKRAFSKVTDEELFRNLLTSNLESIQRRI